MPYQSIEDFKEDIRSNDPHDLVVGWLNSNTAHAFSQSKDLERFTRSITDDYPEALCVTIAGTANWRFSLNPKKNFSEFNSRSDIDVAIVSPIDFEETWNELRLLHRGQWYAWHSSMRSKVTRTGQNVYCGFVSPKNIPDRSNELRFNFLQRCNRYSTALVGHREVNMMFFKCQEDLVDYYNRGVRLARSKV